MIRSRLSIDREFIDRATKLRFIARVGAGLDAIDVAYAQRKNITLISAPEGNSNAVGEHAMGFLLSLMNRLTRADRQVKSGHWQRELNRGDELKNKTVGIIGYGHMGQSFAKKLSGFDCRVLCHDLQCLFELINKQSRKELQSTVEVALLYPRRVWVWDSNAF